MRRSPSCAQVDRFRPMSDAFAVNATKFIHTDFADCLGQTEGTSAGSSARISGICVVL